MKRRNFLYISGFVSSGIVSGLFYGLGPWYSKTDKKFKVLSNAHINVITLLSPYILGISVTEYELFKDKHHMNIESLLNNVSKFQSHDLKKLLSLLKIRFIKNLYKKDPEIFLNYLKESSNVQLKEAYRGLIVLVTTTWYDMPETWEKISYEKPEI